MPAHMLIGAQPIFVTIAADTTDYNVFTSAGSPAARVDVVLTINSGTICGKGGVGGNGGHHIDNVGISGGSTGFTALFVNGSGLALVTIDNTWGSIFGGGGGGGGASGGAISDGGGGGGGRGRLGGPAGSNYGGAGTPPTAGTFSAVGAGGIMSGFTGGDGGDWGQPGNKGADGAGSGASGGPAGNAINAGSVPITFIGGNNSTQVKGAIV